MVGDSVTSDSTGTFCYDDRSLQDAAMTPIPHPVIAPAGVSSRRLYFLHLQKTAGTTVGYYLRGLVSPSEVLPVYFWHQILQLPREEWSSRKMVIGHFGRSYLHGCPDNPEVVVFLRDPIERLRSHWAHAHRNSSHPLHAHVGCESLIEFMRSDFGKKSFRNYQTRSLALNLLPKLEAAWETLENRVGHDGQGAEFSAISESSLVDDALDEEAMLDAAKSLLDSCLFVGLQARLDDSIPILAERLGAYPPAEMPLTNQMPQKDHFELNSEELALARELNHLDLRLYDYAVKIFERNLAGYSRDRHRAWCERQLSAAAIPLERRMYVPMDKPFWGENWWPADSEGESATIKWTGPGDRASMHLPLVLTVSAEIRVRVSAVIPPFSPEDIQLTCNGQNLQVTIRCIPGAFELSAVCPAAPDAAWTVLELTSGTRSWQELHPETSDPGKRGVAISGVEFVPIPDS